MLNNFTFQEENDLESKKFLSDEEFDYDENDEETEREAIELIQKQMIEIQELKE